MRGFVCFALVCFGGSVFAAAPIAGVIAKATSQQVEVHDQRLRWRWLYVALRVPRTASVVRTHFHAGHTCCTKFLG